MGKKNKIFFADGMAWFFDQFGKRKGVTSLDEANAVQSECCGIDCCNNLITLPVNDANGTTVYPSSFQFVHSGGNVYLRVTVDLGAGYVTKEVLLS